MIPRFRCVQLIGANFDVEHATLVASATTETGIGLFFSACGLYPSAAQVHHWAHLAVVASGAPVDCMLWAADDEGERRPIGAVRLRYLINP